MAVFCSCKCAGMASWPRVWDRLSRNSLGYFKLLLVVTTAVSSNGPNGKLGCAGMVLIFLILWPRSSRARMICSSLSEFFSPPIFLPMFNVIVVAWPPSRNFGGVWPFAIISACIISGDNVVCSIRICLGDFKMSISVLIHKILFGRPKRRTDLQIFLSTGRQRRNNRAPATGPVGSTRSHVRRAKIALVSPRSRRGPWPRGTSTPAV